jgi:hypothetical protein
MPSWPAAAIDPLAPALFSTTTGWPSAICRLRSARSGLSVIAIHRGCGLLVAVSQVCRGAVRSEVGSSVPDAAVNMRYGSLRQRHNMAQVAIGIALTLG